MTNSMTKERIDEIRSMIEDIVSHDHTDLDQALMILRYDFSEGDEPIEGEITEEEYIFMKENCGGFNIKYEWKWND